MNSQPLSDAWALSQAHLTKASDGHTGKAKSAAQLREDFNFSLPKNGRSREELHDDMERFLANTTNTLSPYFQNQLFSGLNPYALAGDWLSSLMNTTMATFEVAPFATLVEKELIAHMNKRIGWTNGDGIMVTGGSNANLVGLLLARNTLFPQTKEHGNEGRRLVAFVSEEAHYSFEKAANLMGLGRNQIRKVASDSEGRMSVDSLRAGLQAARAAEEIPFFVAATAGTTVLGAFDPLSEIGDLCEEEKIWFHVDGAWGGSVLLSRKHAGLMKGIHKADSLAWDTHKMLGTGLISSFFLTKHVHALRKSHDSGGGDYIFHDSEEASLDSGPSSLQCGRRNDAFKVWLAWRHLGDEGFEKHVDTLFEKASLASVMIQKIPELELLHDPQMLNICFRFRGRGDINSLQKKIRQQLLERGEFFVNISTRKGITFFRLITVNPALEDKHLSELFNSIINIGRRYEEA